MSKKGEFSQDEESPLIGAKENRSIALVNSAPGLSLTLRQTRLPPPPYHLALRPKRKESWPRRYLPALPLSLVLFGPNESQLSLSLASRSVVVVGRIFTTSFSSQRYGTHPSSDLEVRRGRTDRRGTCCIYRHFQF